MKRLNLLTGSWCGDREHTLTFPEKWDLVVAAPRPTPAMDRSELENRIAAPVDGPPLLQLLTADKTLAVLVDDHTRPTPVRDALTFVIKTARAAGIPGSRIKVVVGLGTHILDREDLLRGKIGSDLGDGIEVVSTTCATESTLQHVGRTARGTPILVNRAFASADVRIGINGVYPHDDVGFSGGAKILVGALGATTIQALHRGHPPVLRGSRLETPFRLELEEIADRIGLHYSINLVLNTRKEIVAAAAGGFRSAFRQAAMVVRGSLGIEMPSRLDLLISNAYPFDTSLSVLGKSTWPFKRAGGCRCRILVTSLCDCSAGREPFPVNRAQARFNRLKSILYLSQGKAKVREWTRVAGTRLNRNGIWEPPYAVYVPFIENVRRRRPFFVGEGVAFYDWSRLLAKVHERLDPNHRARVVVIPSAPLQYPIIDSVAV
jgi:nickel-dependent lactate racemase